MTDLHAERPSADAIWFPAHHLTDMTMSLTCVACGGHAHVTAPCRPGQWLTMARAPQPLAEHVLDGRGDG